MARKGRKQHGARRHTPSYSAAQDNVDYEDDETWSTAYSNVTQDAQLMPTVLMLLKLVVLVPLIVLLLGWLVMVWQAVLPTVIGFVIYAAVRTDGDPDRTLAVLRGWVPTGQQLQSWLSRYLPEVHGSDEQRQQSSRQNSSSSGRCSFCGFDFMTGRFTIMLETRKLKWSLLFSKPDGISTAQMEEALECAADEFNATDSPVVAKMGQAAQSAKVEKLVN